MKTLSSIIEKEIRNNLDEIEICNDLVVSSSENPKLYDGIISLAEAMVEDLIKINFRYLIGMAYQNYEPTEEPPEELEKVEVNTDIANEDDAMLRYIAGE